MTIEEFLQRRLADLVRFAVLLCGSRATAEQLVDAAVERTFRDRAEVADEGAAFARVRVWIVRGYLSEGMQLGAGPAADVDRPIVDAAEPDPDWDDLTARFVTSSKLQRAVTALRYFEGLEIAAIADAMGSTADGIEQYLRRVFSDLNIGADGNSEGDVRDLLELYGDDVDPDVGPQLARIAERLPEPELRPEALARFELARLEREAVERQRALRAERARQAQEEADRAAALEAERQRLDAERAESERSALEQAEAERAEAERLEAERLEAERLEGERLAAERAEAERLAAELAEAERLAAERAEAERLAAELAEAERVEVERLEAERLEGERLAAEQAEADRVEAERLAAERAEAERLAAELAEAERAEAERLAVERAEAERLEGERRAAERAEAERLAAEQAEADRVEAERLAAERADAERADAERREREAAERAEAQRQDAERRRAERERRQQARAERKRQARAARAAAKEQRAAHARLAREAAEQAEAQRRAVEANKDAAARGDTDSDDVGPDVDVSSRSTEPETDERADEQDTLDEPEVEVDLATDVATDLDTVDEPPTQAAAAQTPTKPGDRTPDRGKIDVRKSGKRAPQKRGPAKRAPDRTRTKPAKGTRAGQFKTSGADRSVRPAAPAEPTADIAATTRRRLTIGLGVLLILLTGGTIAVAAYDGSPSSANSGTSLGATTLPSPVVTPLPGTRVLAEYDGRGPQTIPGQRLTAGRGRQLALDVDCSGNGPVTIGDVTLAQCTAPGAAVTTRTTDLQVKAPAGTSWRLAVVDQPEPGTDGALAYPADSLLTSTPRAGTVLAASSGSGNGTVVTAQATATTARILLRCTGSGVQLVSNQASINGRYATSCFSGWSYEFDLAAVRLPATIGVRAAAGTTWRLVVLPG